MSALLGYLRVAGGVASSLLVNSDFTDSTLISDQGGSAVLGVWHSSGSWVIGGGQAVGNQNQFLFQNFNSTPPGTTSYELVLQVAAVGNGGVRAIAETAAGLIFDETFMSAGTFTRIFPATSFIGRFDLVAYGSTDTVVTGCFLYAH